MRQTLRERAMKAVSPRLKSLFRARLHRAGLLRTRRTEQLVLDLVEADGAATFLQIGTNDGQYADPLNLAVHRRSLRGTLVEPQPAFFAAVQRTYRGRDGLRFLNVAISNTEGTLPFYAFDPANTAVPAWLHGSASLDRGQLLRFADRIPDIERHIVEIQVALITVDTLLARMDGVEPEILVVDAEGHDARILRQFDLARTRPLLALYEAESMTDEDAADIAGRFRDAGYRLMPLGQDMAAIRADTRTAATAP